MIKSVSDNQHEILLNIRELHCGGVLDADITYSKGKFYKNGVEPPEYKFDIAPKSGEVFEADSRNLPVPDNFFNSVVFDPPFLCHVKDKKVNSVMANRFSGYWRYNELVEHYTTTLAEVHRVLRKKGVLVFKCQDIIHNHKIHCTHAKIIQWAEDAGFRLLDLYVLTAKRRMPVKAHKTTPSKQKHARVFHCYFLVFKKV